MLSSRRWTSATSLEEVHVVVSITWFNGIMFGIGHMEGDEDDDFQYMILFAFGPLQLAFTKYS